MKKDNVVKDKSYQFAIKSIRFYKFLVDKKKEFIISKQILRSGTATGALIEEANQAESKKDFIHKLSIAQKESFETDYWLRLLRDSEYLTEAQANSLLTDCRELQQLLTTSIKTAKDNLKK